MDCITRIIAQQSQNLTFQLIDTVRYSLGYASSDIYYGQYTSTVPRTYQSSNYYNQHGLKAYELHTIRLKVPICCQACEERITNRLLGMEGVQSVTCDQIK
ncbi:hypothetical protein R1flu_011282 [Riccia fluitans]|uniref:HMA domain-containing protein n=1 Tax=Riccia fluitans TaxID=41844 RepID=A0ABD1Z7D4_9MARC